MPRQSRYDAWSSADSYDLYMGRWSRQAASRFLDWLDMGAGLDWLEVGSGTGALTQAILARAGPASLVGVEPSAAFLEQARARVMDGRVRFVQGDAHALPVADGERDVVVSGLVLNFVPDRPTALAEMRRALRPGGTAAFYVWDYPGGGLGFLRAFWTAALALDPGAAELIEERRFPFCTMEGLVGLAEAAGLSGVSATALEFPTAFRDFDDFWRPFTLGAGPAPGYCAALAPEARERLREALAQGLPRAGDGSIRLKGRAWAVRGASG